MSSNPRPLEGLRVVEVSSFVASPLCGLTLSQLGAEVIRVDPIGGGADVNRWPLTADGHSIYWTGLNRGKKSVTVDFRDPGGQKSVQDLVIDSGPGGGILVTNAGGRSWMSHETTVRTAVRRHHAGTARPHRRHPGRRLHGQRRTGIPGDHRPHRLRRRRQSRTAGVGHRLRSVCRAGDHGGRPPPGTDRFRGTDHPAPRGHRPRHRRGARIPDRTTAGRWHTTGDRKRCIRHLRNRFRGSRWRPVHARRTHPAPLPRPRRDDRDR